AQDLNGAGAGEQQILERRRLEGAIVRRARHEAALRAGPGHGHARADRMVVDQKRIMVPAETGGGGPARDGEAVLDEDRLLAVRCAAAEAERARCACLELSGIGERVGELLAY